MADRPPDLARARRQMIRAAISGVAAAAPLGLVGLAVSAAIPVGRARFFAIALTLATAAVATLAVRLGRWLAPLVPAQRGVSGRAQALRAIAGAPAVARRWAAVHLAVALGFICLVSAVWVPGFDAEVAARVLVVGGSVLPVGAFLSGFFTQVAGRAAVAQVIALGVSVEDVIAAASAERGRFRPWLVALVLLFGVSPAVIVAQAVLAAGAGAAAVVAVISLSAAIACGAAFVAARSLSAPMTRISRRAAQIRDGQLDTPELVPCEGEVWSMAVAFVRLQIHLRSAVAQLTSASARLTTSTSGLLTTFDGQDAGAGEQVAALSETSATTEELARSGAQIAQNAGDVAGMAERTLAAAQRGQRSSEAFFSAMVRMRQQNQVVADTVIRLNKRVQQIGKIVEFINEIADKSDLLALNAELEGTKAGEVGRGFSLVAAEMRRVAEDVMRSTREIERLITDIRDATNAAVMATEAGVKATDAGTGAANQVIDRLGGILEHARQTSESVRSISLATQQQQSGTRQLAEAMAEILRVTHESAAATRQMHGANLDLSALAGSLRAAVLRFDVKGAESRS